jgi:uncharacterized repeat protein (TIGR01451 family)
MRARAELLLVGAFVSLPAGTAAAATIVVTNLNDGGAGSLRAAIEAASPPTTITFDASLAGGTIVLGSPLPQLPINTTIDGDLDDDCDPDIALDGSAVNDHGLRIQEPGCTVQGLAIGGFALHAISVGALSGPDTSTVIECSYLGVRLDGVTPWPNGQSGVGFGPFSGGSRVGPRNVIAHNAGAGVSLSESFNQGAYPEFSGLTPDATVRFPVVVFPNNCGQFHSSDFVLPTGPGNAVFTDHFGMRLSGVVAVETAGDYTFAITGVDDKARLLVTGSTLLDLDNTSGSATVALAAGSHAIELDYLQDTQHTWLKLEITGPGGATVTTSGEPGLLGELFQLRVPNEGITITDSSFFANGGRAIDLGCGCAPPNEDGDQDLGANTCLNSPVLTGATPAGGRIFTLHGTSAGNATVEIYASAGDPSGHGEGKIRLATATASPAGDFTTSITLPEGYHAVTATATDTAGNTSEFADNLGLLTHPITVTSGADSGPGTLRDALEQAASDGTDTVITFSPALAGTTIAVQSPLPPITEAETTLDGDIDGDCMPDIELDGSLVATGGLHVASSDNLVRGLAINRFGESGIRVEDGASPADRNTVACCFIGTDLTGTMKRANGGIGIMVQYGEANVIGGDRATARNVVSGNRQGIVLHGGPGNTVAGNMIGTDVSGTVVLGNQFQAVSMGFECTGNTIGGDRATRGNVISGNGDGVHITSSGNTVAGNMIGTDITGTVALGNVGVGVTIGQSADANLIGGVAATAGNVIAACSQPGILIIGEGTDGNRVEGNLIGTDITGTRAMGNGREGVAVYGGAGNVVGSTDPARRNVIGANAWAGVNVWFDFTTGTRIIGNWIGVGADGVTRLGNGKGVGLWLQSSGSVVGGPGGAANRIAYNASNGVEVLFQGSPGESFGFGNRISRNSIHDNGALGIDIGNEGVESNDPGDGDDGPNRMVNAPVLSSAVSQCGGGATTVSGAVDTSGPDSGVIEIFGSPAADPSGYGEGKTFLAQTVPAFNGSFTLAVPAQPVGSVITATYTDADGNTSEFSNAMAVQTTPLAPSGLQALVVAGPAIDLSWLDSAGDETGFRIERRAAGAPSFSLLASVAANVTTFHDASALLPATTYYYRVRAEGSCPSLWSNVASAPIPGTPAAFCRTTLARHRSAVYPAVDAGSGGFGALWRDCDDGLCAIAYAKLDATGAMTSGPTILTPAGESSMPKIVAGTGIAGGEWGVTWWQYLADQWGVFFARLDDDGDFLSGPIRLNQGARAYPWPDGRGHGLAWDGAGWGVVWADRIGDVPTIAYTRVSAAGAVELEPRALGDSSSNVVYPTLAFDGAHYGVVWVDRSYSPTRLYFRRFTPNGTAAAPSVQVAVGASHDGNPADLVWNGSEYGLAWIDGRDGDRAVYFQRLDAAGAALSSPARLSDPRVPDTFNVFAGYPVLRWLGDRWVVATTGSLTGWVTNEVVLSFAAASGARLGSDVVVSASVDGIASEAPALAWGGASLLAVWHDATGGSLEIHAQATDAIGHAGPNPRRVLTSGHVPGGFAAYSPSVVATGDGYVTAWQDTRRGAGWYDVYLRRLDRAGAAVGDEVLVSGEAAANAYLSSAPPLAFSGEVVGVAWYDGLTSTMKLSLLDRDLERVAADVVLSTTPFWNAALAWTGGAFLAAWVDTRDGNREIYVAAVAPDGTVLQPGARISAAPGVSQTPAIAGDGRARAVAWMDQRDGNQEIYAAALDPLGRRIGPERRITSLAGAQSRPQLAWNGTHHLLVWQDASTPQSQVHATRLGADAAPVGSPFRIDAEGGQAPNVAWGGSVWAVTLLGRGGRYREVDPAGALLGAERRLFAAPWTYSLVTLAWDGSRFVFGEANGAWLDQEPWVGTLDCAIDETPPTCPSGLSVAVSDGDAQLTWTPGGDANGGVWRQAVYRGGQRITVLEPGAAAFTDRSLPPATQTWVVTTLNYGGVESPSCAAETSAGVVFTATGPPVTTEAGGAAVVGVALASQPTADVTIPLSSSVPGEGTISPASLTFTPSGWDQPQSVTITGVDDAVDDGDVVYSLLTGTAASADPDYDGLDPADLAITNLDDDVQADLAVSILDAPDPVAVGATLTYTVTIANRGPSAASGVAMADTLPTTTTFVSAAASQGGCGAVGPTVICSLGVIAVGGSATVTIKATVQAIGALANTATATTTDIDPLPDNNSATATTTVVNKAPLRRSLRRPGR